MEGGDTDSVLELCDIKYTDSEDINNFYFKFRSLVCSHLKKKGKNIIHNTLVEFMPISDLK